MSDRDAGERTDAALQSYFKPGRLSPSQRQRHLAELARAIAAEEEEMEFLKRRSWSELVALVAVLLLVVAGVAFWTLALNSPDEPEDDLVAFAAASLTALASNPTATATATHIASPAVTDEPAAWSGVCEPDPLGESLLAGGPTGDPAHPDWYGDREAGLWVSPVHRGTWLPPGFPDASSRWFTGHRTFLMWYGTNDPLRVTGELLGGDASIEVPEPRFRNPQVLAQWTDFEFPEPGCWRITGEADDKVLTITIEVLPLEQRPDIVFARQLEAVRPDVPSSCLETPWVGPESREGHYVASHWLDGDGISMSIGHGDWLDAGREYLLLVYGDGVTEGLTTQGRNLDRPEEEAVVSQSIHRDSRGVTYIFPSPGCWELELATESSSAQFVTYVHPEGCAPRYEDGEVLVSC